MKLSTRENKVMLEFDNPTINNYLIEWFNKKGTSLQSEATKKAYEEWKMCFPNKTVE